MERECGCDAVRLTCVSPRATPSTVYQTEGCAACTAAPVHDTTTDNAGGPLATVEVRGPHTPSDFVVCLHSHPRRTLLTTTCHSQSQVKLVSVPDMGYRVTDTVHGREESGGVVTNPGKPCLGRGEVCYRGQSVMRGVSSMPRHNCSPASPPPPPQTLPRLIDSFRRVLQEPDGHC
jgi:hypothetical protein